MTQAVFPAFVPHKIETKVFRIVESLEEAATSSIVDTLEEQELLELIIEASKPSLPAATSDLHYLLSTPFRYPPLRHGSRFGTMREPSLFYASCSEAICIAECAYYRFVFFHDMATPPPNPIKAQHSLFSVGICTGKGVDLSAPPFDRLRPQISHTDSYSFTQALGAHLRECVDGFLFPSARAPGKGLNAALFNSKCFTASEPETIHEWYSQVDGQTVSFKQVRQHASYQFDLEAFLNNTGHLPRPA